MFVAATYRHSSPSCLPHVVQHEPHDIVAANLSSVPNGALSAIKIATHRDDMMITVQSEW
jgi:hypothetical protein